jgi:hypothetical protein
VHSLKGGIGNKGQGASRVVASFKGKGGDVSEGEAKGRTAHRESEQLRYPTFNTTVLQADKHTA